MLKNVISVENLYKKYPKDLGSALKYGAIDLLKGITGQKLESDRLRKREFWALKNIGFEIKSGEIVGIIGPNGSGKSTLLKLLGGVLVPDYGKIQVTGKVGSLIEVGAGFHPMLTGRENVYVNGAILGMSRKEVDAKFDAIVNFADIGDFLDTPVKNYSSGMFVRLGFSVAVHADPDILLVDEVLAVGDLAFALKCHRKMSELRQKGVTQIIVSHNSQAIRNICQRVLWLEKGEIINAGPVHDLLDEYESKVIDKLEVKTGKKINYDHSVKLKKVELLNAENKPTTQYEVGEKIVIKIHFSAKREIQNPVFAVSIFDIEQRQIFSNYSSFDGYKINSVSGEGDIEYILEKNILRPGKYSLSVSISELEVGNVLELHEKIYMLMIAKNNRSYGIVNPFPRWQLDERSAK